MFGTRLRLFTVIAVLTGLWVPSAWARDLRVTLPRHSELTPVQRLNREGVLAMQKQQYEKAEAIFYKAYLYDAADPFTLNNLGYISELQGNLNRANKFYAMAAKQGSNAVIDLSNAKELKGKPMTYALGGLKDGPMRVNRMNVQAIELLSQDRNFEADSLLRQALALDPQNAFTLNNMGVAEEATGDLPNALKYYDEAAAAHSSEPIVVTSNRSARGKPVSKMAAVSAQELRKRMRNIDPREARATMLTLRGVSAANQNDALSARKDFLAAYALNPNNAFTLNNLGYLAERNGDLETAKFYYSKAREAGDANARIGLATELSAEGQPLLAIAQESDLKVDTEIDRYSQAERRQTGPVQLLRRDNTPVQPHASPKPSSAPVSPDSGTKTPN